VRIKLIRLYNFKLLLNIFGAIWHHCNPFLFKCFLKQYNSNNMHLTSTVLKQYSQLADALFCISRPSVVFVQSRSSMLLIYLDSKYRWNMTLSYICHFQTTWVKPVPECQTILAFTAARDGGGGGGANWNC